MAKFRLRRIKPFGALAVFLIAWWLVPATVRSFLKASFEEFQAPLWVSTSYLDDFEGFLARRSHSKNDLIEAGQALARARSFYELNASRQEVLENEVERLESILELPPHSEFRYEIARVIRRDINVWWQHITIRKGKNFDIREGAGVVFAGGVVGRVVKVGSFTSQIELITSPNFRIAAGFKGYEYPSVYQGVLQHGLEDPVGLVQNAPQEAIVRSEAPLQLVSTNWGGTFPDGLMIGQVVSLNRDSTGIFQTGEVRLDRRLRSLYEVAVLIPVDPNRLEDDAP